MEQEQRSDGCTAVDLKAAVEQATDCPFEKLAIRLTPHQPVESFGYRVSNFIAIIKQWKDEMEETGQLFVSTGKRKEQA